MRGQTCIKTRASLLLLSFVVLVCLLPALRSIQFMPTHDDLKYSLDDFPLKAVTDDDANEVALKIKPSGKKVAFRHPLYPISDSEALHVSFKGCIGNDHKNVNPSVFGVIAVTWWDSKSKQWAGYDLLDILNTDKNEYRKEIVLRPPKQGLFAGLLIENNQLSGDFIIENLVCTKVTERPVWKWCSAAMMLAWTFWIYVMLNGKLNPFHWMPLLAASAWVLLAALLIYPGPWRNLPPLVIPYHLGMPDMNQSTTGHQQFKESQKNDSSAAIADVENGSKIMTQPALSGDTVKKTQSKSLNQDEIWSIDQWLIDIKGYFSRIRFLLHFIMMLAPTVLFFLLVGEKIGVLLSAALGLGIEIMQLLFGFGFGVEDMVDLIGDASGIVIGCIVGRGLIRFSLLSKLDIAKNCLSRNQ